MAKLPSLVPRSFLPSSRAVKRMVTDFCERSGLVYFGYVSQRSDDHQIVRGMTVSTNHLDDHYCIGTYDGYDVVFVERTDSLKNGKQHVWHIMEFDLKSSSDMPHIFIGSSKRGHGFHELLSVKYPSLQAMSPGTTAPYPASFTTHFSTYVTPAHAVESESIITPEIAETIADHFKGLVMEITEQALYVYSEKSHLSPELLDAMLANGVWLAARLDRRNDRRS